MTSNVRPFHLRFNIISVSLPVVSSTLLPFPPRIFHDCGNPITNIKPNQISKNMAQSQQPQDAFSTYFASPSRYGDRWHNTLYPALLKQQNKAIFYNRYAPLEDFDRITGAGSPSGKVERVTFPSAPNDIQADNLSCYLRNAQIPTPEPLSNGLRPYTYIPTPLALAVHLLQVQPGDRVLEHGDGDGSISVAIAQSLWPHLQPSSPTPPLAGAKKAALHANWVDTGASEPISTAFREHLPTSLGPTGNGEAMILAPGIVPDGGDMIEAPPSAAEATTKSSSSPRV
jgi:hypothetical protein